MLEPRNRKARPRRQAATTAGPPAGSPAADDEPAARPAGAVGHPPAVGIEGDGPLEDHLARRPGLAVQDHDPLAVRKHGDVGQTPAIGTERRQPDLLVGLFSLPSSTTNHTSRRRTAA